MPINNSLNSAIESAVNLTRALVKIPSESAAATKTPAQVESEICRHLIDLCDKHDIKHEQQKVLPNRNNLIIRLPKPDCPKILITAHMDTVSAKGMNDPFGAKIKDGKICGRGACDNKGSLAVLFSTLINLHQQPEKLCYDLTIAGTVDEECSMAGAAMLAKERQVDWDLCLAMEPSLLRPISSHIGVYRCRIVPPQNKHRINDQDIKKCLQAIEADLHPVKQMVCKATHKKLGRAQFSTTIIQRDKTTSLSRILVDIRLLPTHNPAEIHRAIKMVVGDRAAVIPLFTGLGIEADPANNIIKSFQKSIADQGVASELIAVPYPSDCSQLRACGECMVWGPGDSQNAHQDDEYIAIRQIEQACVILHNFLTK